jgi:transposase-like protein
VSGYQQSSGGDAAGLLGRFGLHKMTAARSERKEAMSAEVYSQLACPNPDCPTYGQRGAGNLRLHGWSGRGHRIRCLRCVTCGTDFSERANTPLFGLRTPVDTLVAIAEHLADGCGCRGTARLCKVSLNTVLRFTQRFGKHAEHFHDVQVRGIQPAQIQPDEAWAFVGKKRQTL